MRSYSSCWGKTFLGSYALVVNDYDVNVGHNRSRGSVFRRLGVGLAAGIIASVLGAYLVVPAASADTAPPVDAVGAETVSADPLPTVQVNGVVWSQAVAGNRVFAGGEFSQARPAGSAAGTNQTPRTNLLAYNIATGVLDTSFNPVLNGRVLAADVSPDGTRLYIAGGFTTVNGASRYRLAAFDTATGALVANWSPGTNALVHDIEATNTTVYVTGEFTNINNTPRNRIAALSASTGAVLPFNASLDGGYGGMSIVSSPDATKVVVSGSFTSTNGQTNPGRGMAALDAATGASLPWAINSVVRNGGENASIFSLASDGDSVYGTGYDFGGSKTEDDFEGSFRASWSDGSIQWLEDCHGDTYAIYPFQGAVYTASHAHYCGNIGEFPQMDPWVMRHSLAFDKAPSDRTITPDIYGYRSFTGNPAARMLHWYPTWSAGTYTGMSQAGFDITGNDTYLLYAGEFTAVNGVRQQGIVRFAKKNTAPNKVGPSVAGPTWPITTTSFRAGQARISFQENYDPDNAQLTYDVYRRGTTAPIYTTSSTSTYWIRDIVSYTDSAVVAGQAYEYRVRATDPFGNWVQSDWTPVTVSVDGTATTYDDTVLADNPRYYWPLNEASGTAAYDWATGNDLTINGSATRGATGQTVGESSTATTFSGSNSSFAASKASVVGPQTFSVEAWFKTSSTSGGKIVGFGDKATGDSGSYDRHIYLSGTGRITFGVHPGGVRDVSTGTGFNDGQWHHVVGTLGSAGQTLYVDGVRVGTRADATGAQAYTGYWRVGGDNVGGWPNTGSGYLNGSITDVAVYDTVLTRDQVNAHRVASGRTSALPAAPADNYGKAVFDLDPTLYWRLGETSGTTAADAGRDGSPGTYNTAGTNSIQRNQAGALNGVSNGAIRFTSAKNFAGTWTNRQTVISNRQYSNPTSYALEGWFKTTSTGGGKLIGFGNSNSNTTNASGSYDRHVYMDGSGKLMFGTYNGSSNILTAPGSYRDGAWHYVVAQQSATGMQLFVDGVLAASNNVTNAQDYSGYWRLGGDSGWTGDPFWVGTIDEFAVYTGPLTEQQVQQHYMLGTSGVINEAPVAEFTSMATDLSVAFDASASTDAEGPIASYAWDFGDGETGSGAAISHAYVNPGTYTVELTVTDSGNLTTTKTHDVTVIAANQAPTAAFDATSDFLSVSVNAATSTDPDGTIVSYSWAFGDGAIGSGVTASHTYATAGDKELTLTVTDNRGGSSVLTKTVTVTAPPVPNVAPTAAFTKSLGADGMTLNVDGSTSTDSDGSIVEHAWTFGDGATATGATASHVYTQPGTYTVTLTVKDDDGATDVETASVVAAPPATEDVIALDAFGRSTSSGWGTADKGGAWTVLGGAAAFSATGGKGVVTLAPAQTREARLAAVSTNKSVLTGQVSSDVASAGGTVSATLAGRLVGSSTYAARVRFEPNAQVRLYLLRDEVLLGGAIYTLPTAYVPGQAINVKLSVTGTSPTALGAKIWVDGTAEPTAWQLQATDTTAAMQAAGAVSVKTAVSSASTVATTKVSVDNLKVVTGDTPAPPVTPVPNVAPTAGFESTVSGLTVNVNGASSTDSDGTIAGYAWNFGDGATATGQTATHPYASAGTYPVSLTVTDDDGATNTIVKNVTVTTPPPANVLAQDLFERDTTAGWGTAEVGGAWTALGGAASFTTAGGKGVMTLAPGNTREARLAGVSGTNSVVDVEIASNVASAGGTTSVTVIGRQVGNSVYSARVRFEPAGVIRLYIMRDETLLGGAIYTAPDAYVAGSPLKLRLSVTGTNPTTIAAKLWPAASAEPATWQLSATDTTAAMQAAGAVGVKVAVSSASTVPSTAISIDEYRVTAAQ